VRARVVALEAKRKAEQHQRQFRAALLALKKAKKALETASRIAKKTAKAREEFRKAEDQAASAKALAIAA